MHEANKRSNWRMPLQIPVNEHIGPRTRRSMTFNLGPEGLYLNRLNAAADLGVVEPSSEIVGLEFELPITSEVIWAAGRICHEQRNDWFAGTGVRFAAIASCHRTLIADYVRESKIARLRDMLATVRRNRAN